MTHRTIQHEKPDDLDRDHDYGDCEKLDRQMRREPHHAELVCSPCGLCSVAVRLVRSLEREHDHQDAFSTASATGYVFGLRAAYLPVVATLNYVTPACAGASQVNQLPACGIRVAAFRIAVARLERFVTHTAPAPKAKEAAREMATSLRVMLARFTTLAALIKRKELTPFLTMGGPGRPIDNSIQAFVGAVGAINVELPGKSLPLPG